MAGYIATEKAPSQKSRQAVGCGLVTETYHLLYAKDALFNALLKQGTNHCQMQNEGEMLSFLMEVDFFFFFLVKFHMK